MPQGGDRRIDRRFAGQHDGVGLGRQLLGFGDHLDAAQSRHVEIDEQAVVGVPLERRGGGQAVGADGHLVPHAVQLDPHEFLQRALVVGEEELESFTRLGSDGGSPFESRPTEA